MSQKGVSSLGWTGSALLALGLAATVAYSQVPTTWAGQKSLFAGVLALATGAAVVGWRRARADERSAWLFTSIALGGLLVGDLVGCLGSVTKVGPFNIVDDLIFLPSCLALAMAAALLGSARKGDRDRMALLDAAILTATVGVVAWSWVAERYLGDPRLGTTATLVACAHPLVDVLVIGLSLRLVLSRDGHDRSTVSFASGAILLVVMHLLSLGLNDPGSVRAGSAASSVWLLALPPDRLRASPPLGRPGDPSEGWQWGGRVFSSCSPLSSCPRSCWRVISPTAV